MKTSPGVPIRPSAVILWVKRDYIGIMEDLMKERRKQLITGCAMNVTMYLRPRRHQTHVLVAMLNVLL
jgi:hypothetical protein